MRNRSRVPLKTQPMGRSALLLGKYPSEERWGRLVLDQQHNGAKHRRRKGLAEGQVGPENSQRPIYKARQ